MPPSQIAGFAALALKSLSPTQIAFIANLPKAELHAHLNGSIPIATLQELARDFPVGDDQSDQVKAGLEKLQHPDGVGLEEIHDFFRLFPAIYALTATPEALRRATRGVLREFLEFNDSIGGPQCTYIELRTIPKSTGFMSRGEYARVVLDEIEKYPAEQAALIISVDRKMNEREMGEVVALAISLKEEGRRVVGVDVCGNPLNGDMNHLERHIVKAKAAGLGVTLHIAETKDNPPAETLKLLSYEPNRLGHATFLNDEAKGIVLGSPDMCIEICLSSNLLCKTVPSLEDHHIGYYLDRNHPVAICTDDILPFRNSLLGEYALLIAAPPFGLGLGEAEVRKIAEMSLRSRFGH